MPPATAAAKSVSLPTQPTRLEVRLRALFVFSPPWTLLTLNVVGSLRLFSSLSLGAGAGVVA